MAPERVTDAERPTWLDLSFQLAYTVAYQLLRGYWRVFHPTTHGAMVALWCEGKVLLIRNSYVGYYSAPGGYVGRGETPRQAAARELSEEVGLFVSPDSLVHALEVTHDFDGKHDHVVIFNLELAERPEVRVDYREVVEAYWFKPEELDGNDVFPPLRRVIAERVASTRTRSN